mgnify:CR=1 FL=1
MINFIIGALTFAVGVIIGAGLMRVGNAKV